MLVTKDRAQYSCVAIGLKRNPKRAVWLPPRLARRHGTFAPELEDSLRFARAPIQLEMGCAEHRCQRFKEDVDTPLQDADGHDDNALFALAVMFISQFARVLANHVLT